MNKMKSLQSTSVRASAAALVFAALFITGCATNKPTRTGYLTGYDSLESVDYAAGLKAQTLAPWSAGRPIVVAPVSWNVAKTDGGSLAAARREKLVSLAQTELSEAINATKTNATAGAPLELRAAITRVETSNAAVNVVTTLAVFAPLDNGGICVEWQLIDSADGKVLARGVVAQTGKPWNFGSSFRKTGHAERGLKVVAMQVAAYLEKNQRS